ncbi:hypothetical protein AAE478_001147 [Parahypoxylon ruwenzoriense]
MLKQLLLGSSVLIAALALFLSQWTTSAAPEIPPVRGRNNTVLFLSNSEFGLSNVHLATAYALLEQHPEVHVHLASFPGMVPRLKRVSEHGRRKNPSAQDIVFHELPGYLSFLNAFMASNIKLTDLITPPGYAAIRFMNEYTVPWSGEDHFTLYEKE